MDNNLFENKSKAIESAYEAFESFYQGMDELYRKKEVDQTEVNVVGDISEIVRTLGEGKQNKGYLSWNGDDLTRAEYRLAALMAALGSIASEKVKRGNAMMRWVKFRRFSEWNPAKAKLEKELEEGKRIVKDDIEAVVTKEIFAESMMEAFMAAHADLLTMLFDSTRSILTALSHRINLLKEERQISRK